MSITAKMTQLFKSARHWQQYPRKQCRTRCLLPDTVNLDINSYFISLQRL